MVGVMARLRAMLSQEKLLRFFIALCAVVITAGLQWLPVSGDSVLADEWLRDRFVFQRASAQPDSRIVLVDIDEASIATVGPWPWPRTRIADRGSRICWKS